MQSTLRTTPNAYLAIPIFSLALTSSVDTFVVSAAAVPSAASMTSGADSNTTTAVTAVPPHRGNRHHTARCRHASRSPDRQRSAAATAARLGSPSEASGGLGLLQESLEAAVEVGRVGNVGGEAAPVVAAGDADDARSGGGVR